MSYNMRSYGVMLSDPLRMAAFTDAMRRHVKPGSIVLDLGAGSGILSLLACKFGAQRVYAVDPNPLVWALVDAAKRNGFEDQIVVICADSREIDLPDRVDVILADIRGTLPLFGGTQAIVSDACRRFLTAKGVVLPMSDRMFVAPVSEPRFMAEWNRIWKENDLGVDISSLGRWEFGSLIASQANASDLLSPAQCLGEFSWSTDVRMDLCPELVFKMAQDGDLHGFMGWFDLHFGNGLVLTNAPDAPKLVYGRATFLLGETVRVRSGFTVRVEINVRPLVSSEVWSWAGDVRDCSGAVVYSFRESTLKLASLQSIAAARAPRATVRKVE